MAYFNNIFTPFSSVFINFGQINLQVDLPKIQESPDELITMLSPFKVKNKDTMTISFVMLFAVWYNLKNLNVKNTHGGVYFNFNELVVLLGKTSD